MDERFPRRRRLRKRREYLAVQERGKKIHTRHFLVLRLARSDPHAQGRLGITVSKRVGPAVTRNRIKRLVREFVRQQQGWLPGGVDVVVIAKKSAASVAGLGEVSAELSPLGGRL